MKTKTEPINGKEIAQILIPLMALVYSPEFKNVESRKDSEDSFKEFMKEDGLLARIIRGFLAGFCVGAVVALITGFFVNVVTDGPYFPPAAAILLLGIIIAGPFVGTILEVTVKPIKKLYS